VAERPQRASRRSMAIHDSLSQKVVAREAPYQTTQSETLKTSAEVIDLLHSEDMFVGRFLSII
jgi:hypothetical protein